MRHDDIDFQPNELGEDLGGTVSAPLCPPILDRDSATLDPIEFAQSLHESVGPLLLGRRRGCAQESDDRQLRWLLRARPERPHCRRPAEQRDELAAFHCPMPPVLPAERVAHLSYGRRLLRCGISIQPMSQLGPNCEELGHRSARLARQKSANSDNSQRSKHDGYSITSSAMDSSPDDKVRPSVFAVLRLMTNSNLVGCSTGRSTGFSPLRTRPV